MRTWFITGASRGFGALVAERALAKGDGVVATARNANVIAERLGEQPNLLAVSLDVTTEEQALAAAKAAIDRFGRIDVLLNNAGFGLMGAVEEATAAETQCRKSTQDRKTAAGPQRPQRIKGAPQTIRGQALDNKSKRREGREVLLSVNASNDVNRGRSFSQGRDI